MKALMFDGALQLRHQYPKPVPKPGWALIRVLKAGICRTDVEIVRGYMNFKGILGHEFVGEIDACEAVPELGGQRVVGEINASCGECETCKKGLQRHCPNRSVLGIYNLDGCLAEYCVLPLANLHVVPEFITDEEAVFVEPLSAAFEILDQVELKGNERCYVLGDGKLGILCAWAMHSVLEDVTIIGHHPEKLQKARWRGIKTSESVEGLGLCADIVIDATGSNEGLAQAIQLCRPRGTLVLKTTVAAGSANLAPIVINEINVIGSRCGNFERGIKEMERNRFPIERLVTAHYPMDSCLEAFDRALKRDALKVIVDLV